MEKITKESLEEMFRFLLKKVYEPKPINKGYRDVKMNFQADNRPKIMNLVPLNRDIWYI